MDADNRMHHGHGGAPKGNQRARTRGWTSRLHPAPLAEIDAAVQTALATGDIATLRKAYNAYAFRREHIRVKLAYRALMLLRVEAYFTQMDQEAKDRDDEP